MLDILGTSELMVVEILLGVIFNLRVNMVYIVAILITVFYISFYVIGGSFTPKRMVSYLNKNDLNYVEHKRIWPDGDIEKRFDEDVNPFLFLIYAIQYFEICCSDSEANEMKVYVKWYKRRSLFRKSKGYYVRMD